jgi:hypothetical protein
MPPVGVDGLDRVGLRLVAHRSVRAPPAQLAVRVEGVRVVASSVRRDIDHSLHQFRRPRLADRLRDDAARGVLDDVDDVSRAFWPVEDEQLVRLQSLRLRDGLLGGGEAGVVGVDSVQPLSSSLVNTCTT